MRSYCSKNQKLCLGQPCVKETTTVMTLVTPATPESMAISACVSGWSDWINLNHPKFQSDAGDRELIPEAIQPVTSELECLKIENV